ncbi:hypothetical protein NUK34_01095 [Kerstersia gyiorum]|nr:hypothetical protein [Kerstersia gyiorum]MCR4157455.1 hypothetical protein [Kerstersia gyiorum]
MIEKPAIGDENRNYPLFAGQPAALPTTGCAFHAMTAHRETPCWRDDIG